MGLSCKCEDFDPEPGEIVWEFPREYSAYPRKRPAKCCSCEEKIIQGSICGEIKRFKIPDNDVEIRIYHEDGEIPRASRWMCETCTDLAFSFEDLGYCIQPWENQRELVKEYADEHSKN